MTDDRRDLPIGLSALMADYAPLHGAPDELVSPDGKIFPVWWEFVNALAGLSHNELDKRMARGDQYLRDSGVFFRHTAPGDEAERQWPLSPMPVLIDETEWDTLCEGLSERCDLLETILADLYGDGTLVRDGHIPAPLIAESEEWIRPMVGVTPPSDHYLHFLAFEVGRAPNGQWWVLNDRTQAPSGAGFALENRVATSRIFSEIYSHLNVHRLAGFFSAFQYSLSQLLIDDDSQAALLSPGTMSATYYEHAYIARYLGLLLVEGEDILVERGRPMVRTVGGLKPISVLWRRLDTLYSDPLELAESSQIGVPGLIGAIRQNKVNVINAIGSGILETRAMLAFIPRLSRVLAGGPLKIPNVATWWCGQPKERETVIEGLERMSLAPALSTRLPFDPDDLVQLGKDVTTRDPDAMKAILEHSPETIVGQELVTLSTTPAIQDGRLTPRPFSLRVFMGRTPDGWKAMPGGYARIGISDDVTAVGMHRGGSVADVWVTSKKPVDDVTMVNPTKNKRPRPNPTDLPIRAADNFFWLGRYLERAEGTVRLARAYQLRKTDAGDVDTPLLAFMTDYLKWLGLAPNLEFRDDIAQTISSAAACARRLRDRLSPDGMSAVSELERMTQFDTSNGVSMPASAARKSAILHQLASFTGLVHENMYHSLAWRFLVIGRALERAASSAALLSRFTRKASPSGALDVVLECSDSVNSHRQLNGFILTAQTIYELIVFDTNNPRSIGAQLLELERHLRALSILTPERGENTPLHALMNLQADFGSQSPSTLTTKDLLGIRSRVWELSDAMQTFYMS